jgi:hypothetical protein
VTISASDRDGARAREKFTWTIGNVTRLLHVSVTGLSARHPTLVFTVTVGRRSPAVRRLIVAVPSELRLRSTRSISVIKANRHLRFSAQLSGGRLTLTLRRPQTAVAVVLGPRAVNSGPGGGPHPGRLAVTAMDSESSTSKLYAGIKRR